MSNTDEVSWEQFYEAIGRGISAWSGVENALRDVFSRILVCCIGGGMKAGTYENMWLVGNIFNSITNVPARLQMIDDMVRREVADATLLAEWNAVQNKVRMLYKKRNILAHCGLWGSGTGSGEGASFLRAPFFSGKDETFRFEQVSSWAASFKSLEERTTEFAIAVNRWLVDNRPVAARLIP